jgi:hypothetical protein
LSPALLSLVFPQTLPARGGDEISSWSSSSSKPRPMWGDWIDRRPLDAALARERC